MSSHFTLELDTTPPMIEIFAPNYTTKETENHITIEANENISYQEIYIIDSNDNRYDFQFDLNENKLIGVIKLNQLPLGIAILHVRVKDEVDNISDLYQHKIEIKENMSRLRMDISHDIRPLFISTSTREMILNIEI